MRRLTFAFACAATLLACAEPTTPVSNAPPLAEIPVSGDAQAGMGGFDQAVINLMRKYNLPGGALAVVYEGRLVYARGFGYADVENQVQVQPDALFRLASVSKSITSTAIMTLVQDGKLSVDDHVAPLLADLAPAPGKTVDPRWDQITIRHLLTHTAGWDRTKSGGFDPNFLPSSVTAGTVGAPSPASPETIIRYMKGMPIDFDPGSKFVYSNFGYMILGRVIEVVGGMPYEDYVRSHVLLPVGATRTRVGKSRLSEAFPGEVRYYMFPSLGINAPMVPSVFPGEGLVPLTYGGFYMEPSKASGAWVSSTIDLLRFINGVDGRSSRPDILNPALITAMTGDGAPLCTNGSCYYGFGWFVRPMLGDATWWHGGSLNGTATMIMRSYDGVSLAVLFNARSESLAGQLEGEIEFRMTNAINAATNYPAHDLFPNFP